MILLIKLATADTGAAHVRGQLLCHGKPYAGQKVQLWEKIMRCRIPWLLMERLIKTDTFPWKDQSLKRLCHQFCTRTLSTIVSHRSVFLE
ncbi:TransThyretin-Related family domain [Caenorhabditis elegans]|uniref:TransThyretin-Related family domain n=1 Tax=Caenorhabditis elegans TaxID=6239 RepID=A8DZ50_CAEEL|nr:TransThyretin-Related family domain [Caenorhabditis elegans]CAP09180.2 TransThyretin-Related family domain [Caenorhabditis elegans]|eukprot:NP_001122942.2 TransThyretin-Related family domain [Caenorhabditis elegans]